MPKNRTPAGVECNANRLSETLAQLQDKLVARTQELDEAREQQSATAEILETINRAPTDLGPVFETIVTSAVRLCEANFAFVMLNDDEDGLRLAASTSCTPAFAEYLNCGILANPTTTTGRAALQRKPVQVLDFLADHDVVVTPAHRAENVRTVLAVPMCRGKTLLGVFSVWRREVRSFSDDQIRLLETFASQAAIAIETVRLFDEIQEKNRQLELANTSKSRFLAAASHDLRQPLHALNLFSGQLQVEADSVERKHLIARIDATIQSMNELFDALLDVSRLDADALEPNLKDFQVQRLLARAETTFGETARKKGLRLRVVSSKAWVRSDFVLLERILFNLVSNAVRYTSTGGVVIGCRNQGDRLRLEVWDSGAGIPENQRQTIFAEFYQLTSPEQDQRAGLGLGLAIVERLGHLLDHPVELASKPGAGSRFSVSVPLAREPRYVAEVSVSPAAIRDSIKGKLIVVIDNDPLVLEGMGGILRNWDCSAVTVESAVAAVEALSEINRRPDLIISDFRLTGVETGIKAIEHLRKLFGESIPAFLISGDTTPEGLRHARESGHDLLHKPVSPMRLRAMVNQLLKNRNGETGRLHKTS